MSVFTPEDLNGMTTGGNLIHNAKYLARHNPREHPIPNGSDITKLREFIKSKYVDKKWYAADGRVDALAASQLTVTDVNRNPSPIMFDTKPQTSQVAYHHIMICCLAFY